MWVSWAVETAEYLAMWCAVRGIKSRVRGVGYRVLRMGFAV